MVAAFATMLAVAVLIEVGIQLVNWLVDRNAKKAVAEMRSRSRR